MFATAAAYGAAVAAAHVAGLKVFDVLDLGVKDFKKRITIVNRAVCSIHASVIAIMTFFYWVARQGHFWRGFEVEIHPEVTPLQNQTIQMMLGYLVADTFVEAIYGKGWMTLAHHFCGIASHAVTLLENDGCSATYSMMVYLAESSTPFLHTSWILKELNRGEGLFFMFNVLAMVCNFFVFRVLLSPYLLYHMVHHWLPQSKPYIFFLNVFLCLIFIGLNYYWFYLIVKVIPIPGLSNKKKKTSSKKKSAGDKLE